MCAAVAFRTVGNQTKHRAKGPDISAKSRPPAKGPSSASSSKPKLAQDVELLGEYEGSGFKEPRYMARRSNGDLIQLTELLYLIAEEIDGSRDHKEIADRVSERFGKAVTADNVKTLIERHLINDGLVLGPGDKQPQARKPDPLLALKFKLTLLPERAVNFFAAMLRPLFWPPVMLATLAGFVALDVWYFGIHGVAQSLRDLIYQPLIVLMVYGLLIVSILWHELGHATACRYGGARPGRIGFGIYIVWPAFFTDVTDALTLSKGGRVRTDLGGLYFNALFCLGIAGVYFLTGFEPLLVLIVMQHLLMLYNLMPFLRLDGYHAISDITGIPDLFSRIKPTVKGLIPGKETPREVKELKTWARTVVTVWVLLVIPILLYFFGMMVLSAPRVVATGWDSLLIQWDRVQGGLAKDHWAQAGVGSLQAAMIVLPTTGMFVSFSRIGKRIGQGFWKFTRERPVSRVALGLTGTAAIGIAAFILLPNGEYKPIQPDERWTVAEGLEASSQIMTGRPSLTTEREEKLGGAPALSESGETFVPSYTSDGGTTPTIDPTPSASYNSSPSPSPYSSPSTSPSPSTYPSPSPDPSESPTSTPSP